MKVEIKDFIKDENNTFEDIAFYNYIQKKSQHKNEIFINTNILILVVRGTKILHFKNQDVDVDKEHFLFLKSGEYIMSEVLDEYYEAMLFLYEDSLLIDFISKYNISFENQRKDNFSFLKIKSSEELNSLMKTSFGYFKSKMPNKEELIKLKLEEAFLNILNSSISDDFKALLFSVYTNNYFKVEVERNFSYEESILDLKDIFNMTSLSFRENFKKVYNTTPKKWQNIKRLEKAKILLENTDKNVSEVCREVGFDNLSWFVQVFKKQYKQTPKQIKNNKN